MPAVPFNEIVDIMAAADPAASKHGADQLKRTTARMTCVVVGQDLIGRVFCLHAWAARTTTEAYIDHLLGVNERWRPRRFGIEANAMQVLFGESVALVGRMRGVRLPLEPIYQPTNIKKPWRIRTALQPLVANGRLFLQEDQHELQAEILGHPNYPTCDLVDALATAVALLPKREGARHQDDEELRALAQYLRESGAPASYIQQRIVELQRDRGDLGWT